MEVESRKRGRELETMERSEHGPLMKKLDVDTSDADGCCGGGGDDGEEETGRGVFDFPWLKGEGEGGERGGGVMSEEEWKAAAAEDTFLGSLGGCCCEREEVEMEGGLRLPLLEDTSATLSLVEELEDGVSLEETWDRDDIWTSLLH